MRSGNQPPERNLVALEAKKARSITSIEPMMPQVASGDHFQSRRATTIASTHSITIVADTAMP